MLPNARHRPPAAVVFDCDGVLIESADLKTEAFTQLFAEYPEHLKAIVDHHQQNLGISRFEKFEWIYRELLGVELTNAESVELGLRFSELVFDRACRCDEVAGTADTLRRLHSSGVPLFVASGTPQAELERLIESRGWTELFGGIHGSPRTKPEIISAIAASLGLAPEDMVLVGDGRSDWEAAREVGTRFVWRETEAQKPHFRDFEGLRVRDLSGLPERLADAASLAKEKR